MFSKSIWYRKLLGQKIAHIVDSRLSLRERTSKNVPGRYAAFAERKTTIGGQKIRRRKNTGHSESLESRLLLTWNLNVEIVQVCDDAGNNCAALDPTLDSDQGYAYSASVNEVWAQADVQVSFSFSTWNNTAAQRLTFTERDAIYEDSFTSATGDPLPDIPVDALQIFFVNDHPGTGYNGNSGTGWVDNPLTNPQFSARNAGNNQLFIDGTFVSNGRGVMANEGFVGDSLSGTITHEIGHGLGLRHVEEVNGGAGAGSIQDPSFSLPPTTPNLMWGAGFGPNYDFALDNDGTLTTLQENFPLLSQQIAAAIFNGERLDPDGNGIGVLQNLGTGNIVVDTTSDVDDGDLTAGNVSLREAITLANTNPGADIIEFNIPGTGPHVIAVGSPLPAITEAVSIDASTEPDFTGLPVVGLDGNAASAGTNGLTIQAADVFVSGLAIYNFAGDGIFIDNAAATHLTSNVIGLDTTGASAGNGVYGVQSLAGTNGVFADNVISGNGKSGILLTAGADFNTVTGNRIGTDTAGNIAIQNQANGIHILRSADNHIEGNQVSGNRRNGITIGGKGATRNDLILNNVGLNANGTAAIGNGEHGIQVRRGRSDIRNNVSSGNGFSGIVVSGGFTDHNTIRGNTVGLNMAETAAIPNTNSGIIVYAGDANEVRNNTTSGNLKHGILVSGGATQTQIIGNRVGTNGAGDATIGNQTGIRVQDNSTGTTITSNTVSGNADIGITLTGGGNSIVTKNRVGISADGSTPLTGQQTFALEIRSGNNVIGGSQANANEFGASLLPALSRGILIGGSGATGNTFSFNFVGTNADESITTSAFGIGVLINGGASANVIGPANTIANNNTGVRVTANAGNSNRIRTNSIRDNTAIGIDLAATGQTANDAGDPDENGNRTQNYPVLLNGVVNGAGIDVTYSVDTLVTNAAYPLRIEFYLDDGNGQGEKFLGQTFHAQANAGLTVTHTLNTGASQFASGNSLVATVTDAANNTSEFSLPLNGATGAGSQTATRSAFDFDGNGRVDPLTDAITVVRYLAGFSGDSLATTTDPANLEAQLSQIDVSAFDFDGDGVSKPLTDGVLLVRYAAGFRGDALIKNVISTHADSSDEFAVNVAAKLDQLSQPITQIRTQMRGLEQELDELFADAQLP